MPEGTPKDKDALWVLNLVIAGKRYPGQIVIHERQLHLVMQFNMYLFDKHYKNTPLAIFERYDRKRMVCSLTPEQIVGVKKEASFWNKRVWLTLRNMPEPARLIGLDRGMMPVNRLFEVVSRFAAQAGMESAAEETPPQLPD